MRLLQIDDDPHVGRAFQKVARGCGYDVQITDNAKSFKAAYQSFKPDVIILDLIMPETDGIELLRFLADAGSLAKILIISGFDRKILEAAGRFGEAQGLRIAGILSKPVRSAALRKLLNGFSAEAAADGVAPRLLN